MKAENMNISVRGRLVRCGIVVVMIAILCPSAAQGQDAYWSGGTGDWFDSGNWLFGDLPDLNQVGFINNGGTAIISAVGAEAQKLTIGDSAGTGSLTIDGGALNLTAGGTAGNMSVADGVNSSGSLTIISGSLDTRSNLRVGRMRGATAVVTQSGGSVDIAVLEMGDRDGTSSYTIDAGTLTFDRAEIHNSSNSTSSFVLNGGTVEVDNTFWETKLLSSGGGSTSFTQAGGIFTSINDIIVGNGGSGTAVWSQSAGTASVTDNNGIRLRSQGTFNLSGTGELTTTKLLVEGGRFNQSGGTLRTTSADGTQVYDSGELELGGTAEMITANLTVGQRVPASGKGAGHLAMTGASATASISGTLSVGPEGTFTAVPGATIHFTGSAFENLSTNESALGGLANVTFVFEGGISHWSTFEVAGRDIGLQPSGFESNFALGGLEIGGASGAKLRLQDIINNGNRSSPEALYVHDVTLAAGSTLDMGNLNLYFDGTFRNLGGTIINGEPTPGPDPIPLRTVSVEDVAGEFTPSGGAFGLGELTAAGQANVVVGRDSGQATYTGGSFAMTVSLQADDSDGGTVAGKFREGSLSFLDAGGRDLLTGDLIRLSLNEIGDDEGMLAGKGLFTVTGGRLEDDFGELYGEMFQMIFEIDPAALDDFSGSFSGFTNITVSPVPEPGTLGLLAIGGLAVLRRRRRGAARRDRNAVSGGVPRGFSMIHVAVLCGLLCAASLQARAGLVARYSFDNSFADTSGYGFNATTQRAPTFNTTDAKFGSSADFEADSRLFLEVTHNSMFTSLEDMTIAMWLKPESWNGSSRVFQKGGDGDWRLHAGGNNFKWDQHGRTAYTHTPASTLIPIGQWTHIAAVVDAGSDVIKVYANGTEVASEFLQGRGIHDTTRSLFIGAKEDNNNNGDYFDGLMDEFQIYGDALSSSQITELMNDNTVSTFPPPPPPPPPTNASIEISALIDGRDQLIIRDGTLQWEHFDNAAVGRHMGQNIPTTITTTVDGQVVLDHLEWTPQWSVPPPDDMRRREHSSIFTGLLPEFPELEQTVQLAPLQVRRDASIVQQPSEANDYTLVVEFNDNSAGSSEMYTLRLDYRDSEYEPVPLRSVGAVDIAAEFTPHGGDHGLGQFTAAGPADVIVEEDDGEQTSYIGGSFAMTASLSADNSAGGLASGRFDGGTLAFRDSGGADLLTGDLIELELYEVGDGWGMLAGDGTFVVTGGTLEEDFLHTHGEIFQMLFNVSPSGIDNFSAAFTGFTSITVTPAPEPATLSLLALGGLAVLRRRRRR